MEGGGGGVQTTSVADISSFFFCFIKGEEGDWLGWSLNPVDCLHKAFPCWLSCMCEGLFFPSALLLHIVCGVSLFGTAVAGSDSQCNDSRHC